MAIENEVSALPNVISPVFSFRRPFLIFFLILTPNILISSLVPLEGLIWEQYFLRSCMFIECVYILYLKVNFLDVNFVILIFFPCICSGALFSGIKALLSKFNDNLIEPEVILVTVQVSM